MLSPFPPLPEFEEKVYTPCEEMGDIFTGERIRCTTNHPVLVSVSDIIRTQTEVNNPHMMVARLQMQ
jgi:hypothetical protein